MVDEEAKKVAEGLTSEATASPKIMKIQETADDQQICGKAEATGSDEAQMENEWSESLMDPQIR